MNNNQRQYKVTVVAPTCYYYQSDLFRDLTESPRISLKVYFCSEEGLTGQDVSRLHETTGDWGVGKELLDGFNYKFLKNYSPIGSYLKRFGLFNVGIWKEIKRESPDVVVLLAWNNPTFWLALLACSFYKIPVLYMTDANWEVELSKGKMQARLKGALLRRILFNRCLGFLCSGTANRRLFGHWGVAHEKLVDFAYSWGYQHFIDTAVELEPQRPKLRAELGIPEDSFVIIYCGRLSKEKNLFHLFDAFHRVRSPNKTLVVVGDGNLKKPLLEFCANHHLDSVHFFGFQQRSQISKFYTISDALVLPSIRETWGIVVSEAMCFGLPPVISENVGAGEDLVEHGYNGFRYNHEEVETLANHLEQLMEFSEEQKELFRSRSLGRIKEWSNRDLAHSLVSYLDSCDLRQKNRT